MSARPKKDCLPSLPFFLKRLINWAREQFFPISPASRSFSPRHAPLLSLRRYPVDRRRRRAPKATSPPPLSAILLPFYPRRVASSPANVTKLLREISHVEDAHKRRARVFFFLKICSRSSEIRRRLVFQSRASFAFFPLRGGDLRRQRRRRRRGLSLPPSLFCGEKSGE